MSRIVPAILTDDPGTLEVLVRQAETFAGYVQIAIMDGQFVPSRSVTWQQLVAIPIKFTWEAHLMVAHPEEYLAGFREAGAKKIVFHHEATTSPEKVISLARSHGLEVGLAINPPTPVSAILPLAGEVDSILFLSVHPGFYGSEFIPEVLDKITEFRKLRPEVMTALDGGVKENNIVEIARTGVSDICVGSAVFKQAEPAAAFRHLQALAGTG
jgi:ribulose-phosphate 3-epimerase